MSDARLVTSLKRAVPHKATVHPPDCAQRRSYIPVVRACLEEGTGPLWRMGLVSVARLGHSFLPDYLRQEMTLHDEAACVSAR